MTKQTIGPKFVKPANMWIVTIVDLEAKKAGQFDRNWFATFEEAQEFKKKTETT